jgi:hypothetical protein
MAINKAVAAFLRKHKGAAEVGGEKGSYGDTWSPSKSGETISGTIKAYRANQGDNEQNVIDVETDKGTKSVWLTTVLDNRISKSDVGRAVLIEFTGTKPAKKKGWNPTKLYTVYMGPKRGR